MDRGILGDLFLGLSFSFDFPRDVHLALEKENLILTSLALAKVEGVGNWFDSFYDFLETQGGEDRLLGLRREYQRLFELPSPRVPPYEHFYRGESLSGFSVELLREYNNFGYTLSKTLKDYPDHITVELEFAGRLSHAVVEGTVEEEKFKEFMEGHVLYWIPTFAEKVLEESREEYYRQVAQILKEVLEGSDAYVGMEKA
jgi:TorA maturation chaperone TorD